MDVFDRLEQLIRARRADAGASASYIATLQARGPSAIARKVGEEAVETVIAALEDDPVALTSEAADLIFHLMLLLEARGLSLAKVAVELERREGLSGLAEKAARKG